MKELENIIGFDALYESMIRCKKNVLWKSSVAGFYLNGIGRVSKLAKELQTGTYKPMPTKHFKITSPKPREIASIMFRDRVYQRSLNDNVIYPTMSRSFILDNCACQKGKGTDFARNRLKESLRKFYRTHGCDGYVAQLDIRGYYPNMSHEVVENLFREKLPKEVFDLTLKILKHQYEGETGYNPGSQLIQIAGISILDKIDHHIKERLHMRHYVRYMDDLIMIHHDKEYLLRCLVEVERMLNGIHFELNKEKTKVYPLNKGIRFLGFDFRLTDTGKVLMNVDPKNVKRERLKLRRLVARSKKGYLPKSKVDESYNSWRNHAEKGNSYKLLQRMDAYYKQLWEEENVCKKTIQLEHPRPENARECNGRE